MPRHSSEAKHAFFRVWFLLLYVSEIVCAGRNNTSKSWPSLCVSADVLTGFYSRALEMPDAVCSSDVRDTYVCIFQPFHEVY